PSNAVATARFKPLPDVGIFLARNAMDIVSPAGAPPRNTSGTVWTFDHVKDGADVVHLKQKIHHQITVHTSVSNQPTLRSVTRALSEDANGLSETTTAPSFRSRNLGRRASLTAKAKKIRDHHQSDSSSTHETPKTPCCSPTPHPPWESARSHVRSSTYRLPPAPPLPSTHPTYYTES